MNSTHATQQQVPIKRTRILKNQLGQLIDKIGKSEKESTLLEDLHLDTVEEARKRKHLEEVIMQKSKEKKAKITSMVKEFFKSDAEELKIRLMAKQAEVAAVVSPPPVSQA